MVPLKKIAKNPSEVGSTIDHQLFGPSRETTIKLGFIEPEFVAATMIPTYVPVS